MTVMVMMAVVMMMMPMVIAPPGQPRPPRESRGGPTGAESGDQTKNTKGGGSPQGGRHFFQLIAIIESRALGQERAGLLQYDAVPTFESRAR